MEQVKYFGESEKNDGLLASGDHASNSDVETAPSLVGFESDYMTSKIVNGKRHTHKPQSLQDFVPTEGVMNEQSYISQEKQEEDCDKVSSTESLMTPEADSDLHTGEEKSHDIDVGSESLKIPLEEISKLLICVVCKAMPMTSSTVHTCNFGHQTCGHCFKQSEHKCEMCQEPLEGRNEVLECVLQQLKQNVPYLFPQDSLKILDSELEIQLEEATRLNEVKKLVNHSCHKVVLCPHLFCRRRISSNGFHAHFEFEHMSVPVFQVPLNCSQVFSLPLECLEDDKTRAVAVIQVNLASNKCEILSMESKAKVENKVPAFPVRRDIVLCVLLCASVKLNNNLYVVTWCSSLYEDKGPLIYSLQAQSDSGYEVSHTGPTWSLHQSQDPESILTAGQCLLLAPGMFEPLLDQDEKSLYLDIQFVLN